jgi:hypothetical protein
VSDEVVAKNVEDVKSQGKVVIPKGSKLIGHVTEVKAAEKGSHTSTLGIAFDKAILNHGTEVPLNVTIQAIAESQSSAAAAMSAASVPMTAPAMGGGMAPAGRPGMIGGAVNTVGGAAGVASTTGMATTSAIAGAGVGGGLNGRVPLSMNGQLQSNAQGVVGLPGLGLRAGASQDSVIASNHGNVRLDSGTQMVLRANGRS